MERMMNVNKYIFTKKKMADEPFMEIPFELTYTLLDRTDSIETNFIDVEVKKALGSQEDIEKIKLIPKHYSAESMILDIINIDVELTNSNGSNSTTYLSHLGLEYEDLEFRSNRFKRTFLRFEYFDTDDIQTQTKIGEHTMFLDMLPEYYNTRLFGALDGVAIGSIKQPNSCRLRFKTYNPKNNLNSVSEGYNLFLSRKEVGVSTPNIIYMRVSLNSAVTGITHRLCTSKTALPIDQLVDKLHIPLQVILDNNQPKCIYNYGTVSTNTKTLTMTFYECISQ